MSFGQDTAAANTPGGWGSSKPTGALESMVNEDDAGYWLLSQLLPILHNPEV